MNLRDNAPTEFLRGWMHVHRIHSELSPLVGPQLQNGYRLGVLQEYRLRIALARRTEDGFPQEFKVRTRKEIPLIFGYKRSA